MKHRTVRRSSFGLMLAAAWWLTGTAVAPAGDVFDASGVTLLGRVDLPEFSGNQDRGNDIWGYVSPSGREYAIMGLKNGTSFVEVTDPENPVEVGYVAGPNSIWRDMKTYDEYCYAVSEAALGLQIIDLTRIDFGVVSQAMVSNLDGSFFTAHNIANNPASHYVYPVLSSGFNVGITAVDVSDPMDPQIAGMWTEKRTHDVQVVTYDDEQLPSKEIAFAACEGNGVFIVDVTDKGNMHTIGSVDYPNSVYAHQGWLSKDKKYFFLGDELDPPPHRTMVFNVEDLENPQLVTTFSTGLDATDHNLMVRGDFVFEANYSSGLRIFDVSDPLNATEVGYFDTYPENNAASYLGAWGVYSGLPSGIVILSDRERGLFIFDVSEVTNRDVPGDGNGDGLVNLIDFESMEDCRGGPAVRAPQECATFDLDVDEDVDWTDSAIFQRLINH